MDSILTSIKKKLGVEEDYVYFDEDIIIDINTALMSLNQIGVGPKEGFAIQDAEAKWADFIGERKDIESVKSYIYLKVRLIFDPPQSSYLLEAITKEITELEWRLNVQVEGSTV